ncbi:MAG TPA: DUF2318 domain-containing protein, partial [Geobacteraceae bacterium]
FLMGAITAANLAATLRSAPLASITLIALGGCFVANIAYSIGTFVHRSPESTPLSLFLLKCTLVFFGASLSPRLDIFAPLSMKIMKFIHDFLHQFMESMLLPDHLFITSRLWNLIGLLFSKEVGFWGGLVLWFVPVLLASLAIVRLPLPTVAHVRQGALRRSMRAAALHRRRRLLIIPAIASLVLAWSVYHSLFPHTQFWDPAPVAVEASAAGEIDLPLKQGEIDLRDGRLHKFSYARGNSVVRFIVLNREDSLVVVLDACAICPPEGYGQGDGTVICHYCKTLIPLETVGLPGGCNPVPVTFTTDGASVRIPSLQLTNLWDSTVQTTQANAGKNR